MQEALKLEAPKRYEHAIKQIVGWGELWGLYDNGWALVGDGTEKYLALWPAKEYAELCINNEWGSYHSKNIKLEDFMEKTIKDLIENRIHLAIFITPEDKGITPSYEEFVKDINNELERY